MANFEISWSFAAFKKIGEGFLPTHNRILEELQEVAAQANGWFFHAVEIETGWLRCDAQLDEGCWHVIVREAKYVSSETRGDGEIPVQFPEPIDSADNHRFATFDAIQTELKKQERPSLLAAFLSKVGFPRSRE